MLRFLIIKKDSPNMVDFNIEPWNGASLVTPRHAVRTLWNAAAIRKHCKDLQQQLFVCPADDTVNGRQLKLHEMYALLAKKRTEGRRKRKDLPETAELAKGAKVMVTKQSWTSPTVPGVK
jgi:hypothetical protein